MVLWRGMRDAGSTRRRAQGQPLDAVALQHPLGGAQQSLAQCAVMISAGGFGRFLATIRFRRDRLCMDFRRSRVRLTGALGSNGGRHRSVLLYSVKIIVDSAERNSYDES